MNEKLHIPRFRYLTQDYDGDVFAHLNKPRAGLFIKNRWESDNPIHVSEGARNPDWENTLIDLDAVNAGCAGYTFENGILKPVDCGISKEDMPGL